MASANTLYTSLDFEDSNVQPSSAYTSRFRVDHGSKPNDSRPTVWHKRKHVFQKRAFRRFYCMTTGVLPLMLSALSMAALGTAIALLNTKPVFARISSFCSRSGSFSVDSERTDNYDPWNTAEVFAINLASGPISFGLAKLADILWDMGVGRGGQGILAVVSYQIYTKSVCRIMQNEQVSCRTFEALTLQDVTLTALANLIMDFQRNATKRSRLIILNIILSTIFLLAFPTLVSAMTGYSAVVKPIVVTSSGELIPLNLFDNVMYTIHDGSRIGFGLSDEYPVIDPNIGDLVIPNHLKVSVSTCDNTTNNTFVLTTTDRERAHYMKGCSSFAPGKHNSQDDSISIKWPDFKDHPECDLLWHLSEYTSKYGFLGRRNEPSTFSYRGQDIPLPSPVLSITPHFSNGFEIWDNGSAPGSISWAIFPYGGSWSTDARPNSGYAFKTSSNLLFAHGKLVYNLTGIAANGRCQQQGTGSEGPISYQWGFSYALLLVFLVLFVAWVIIMSILYLDAYFNLQPAIEERNLGRQRAVIDIAQEYQHHTSHIDATMYDNQKIQDLTRESVISYQNISTPNLNNTRWEKLKYHLHSVWEKVQIYSRPA